jgi:uncharacterized protein YndB with AHSA1/START domain
MVPTGMSSHVHAFDAREGGSLRISLTYTAPTDIGKKTARTDTFPGRFVKLVTNEQVVEVVEFETTDPALRGEMTITIALADADGGTEILAVHDGLPACRPSTTTPAGGRHSGNSRRSSRRARPAARWPIACAALSIRRTCAEFHPRLTFWSAQVSARAPLFAG